MMDKRPAMSVLMSVHNGQPYLRQAVDSILTQTYRDFEFIIVDDGSTDRTWDILNTYSDPRVVLLRNQENVGLTKSLNKAFQVTRGEYIARQDADDVSLPQRLEEQASFLDDNPAVALISCSFIETDESARASLLCLLPASDDKIMATLVQGINAFCHGAVMFRRQCAEQVGLYREEFELAQDYDLWLRIAEHYKVANLTKPLYKRRTGPATTSIMQRSAQDDYARLALDLAEERARFGKDSLGAGLTGRGPGTLAHRKVLARNAFFWGRVLYQRGEWSGTVRMLLKSVTYHPLEGSRRITSSLGHGTRNLLTHGNGK